MIQRFAGIDLGGTATKAAIADEAGTILAHDSIPTQAALGPEGVLKRIVDVVHQLLARTGNSATALSALGMGVPGLVEMATGTVKFLPNLPTQWRDVPAAAFLRERLQCPVHLLNDVRLATLGELRFGHGKGDPRLTMAFFSIGTGIGGGVAIDGALRLGPLGAAGELGHQTVLADGPQCGCGNRGCLESLASGPAIVSESIRLMTIGLAPRLHAIVDGHCERVTTRVISQAATEGDARIREVVERVATWIGIAAANVVTILHPDLVVLGGGVAEMGEMLRQPVHRTIRQRVGMFPTDQIRVENSLLGELAGLHGAIALACEAPES